MSLVAALCVGLTGVATGWSSGAVGAHGIRAVVLQEKVFPPMIVMLVFAGAGGMYGLILGLICAAQK